MSLIQRQYDAFVWGLKYRPNNLDELILPDRYKNLFKTMIDQKQVPNLLLSGHQGTGKTSVSFILADHLNLDVLYLNLSKDTGIDILRGKVEQFVSSVSFNDLKKMVIFDEADRASGALQDGLKATIEDFSKNCSFVFTTNHKNKIIAPLISRLQQIDFMFASEEAKKMSYAFFHRVEEILKLENVEYDKKAVGILIQKLYPDMRLVLNELQRYSMMGPITADLINSNVVVNLKEYANLLKEKHFPKLRKFIAEVNVNAQYFYSEIFANIESLVNKETIAEAIIILSKYSYESAFVVDHQLNLTACSLELMLNCKFGE